MRLLACPKRSCHLTQSIEGLFDMEETTILEDGGGGDVSVIGVLDVIRVQQLLENVVWKVWCRWVSVMLQCWSKNGRSLFEVKVPRDKMAYGMVGWWYTFCILIVPLGVGIFRLPIPVKNIEDCQEANKTGIGLVSLDSSLKKGESPLTQADTPKSIRTVLLLVTLVSIAQIWTLSGLSFRVADAWPICSFPD
jgi:hypothetical protein